MYCPSSLSPLPFSSLHLSLMSLFLLAIFCLHPLPPHSPLSLPVSSLLFLPPTLCRPSFCFQQSPALFSSFSHPSPATHPQIAICVLVSLSIPLPSLSLHPYQPHDGLETPFSRRPQALLPTYEAILDPQVFRFLTRNNFLLGSPGEPLVFPLADPAPPPVAAVLPPVEDMELDSESESDDEGDNSPLAPPGVAAI